MKLAYFINQYPKVSHTFIRREIEALEAQGCQVLRVALRGWDADVRDADDLAEQASSVYLLRSGLAPLLWAAIRQLGASPALAFKALLLAMRMAKGGARPWPYHLVYWLEACALKRLLNRRGIGHMHAHFGTNAAEVAMLARAMGGATYSFTVHGPEEFDQPHALHLTEKIQHSAFAVAISSFGRSQLWRWLPAEQWGKVEVVHCGLDAAFLDQQATQVPDVSQLVCVGRLCEQKGQLLLVQALGLLRDKGVQATLVLAGDGEMRAAIEAEVARCGLQDRVSITGWIDSLQVREVLEQSRALVLPSFAEGLPVVLMEAMALQRPVLTTWIAGVPELVRSGDHGWLFEAGSVEAAAAAMEACLQTPISVLRAMGAAGRERVKARHDARIEARKLFRLFSNLAEPGSKRRP